MRCRHNTVDNNGDITVNYSELEEPEEPSESAVAYGDLEMPEAPTESTASFASSILEEEALSFDITRPERQLAEEEMETSLQDTTVTDVPPPADITYTVVDSGSERGKPKLVSSDGYAFVFKRKLASGTVHWRCSVRGRTISCQAGVKQTGDEFVASGSNHTHPAKPGLLTTVQVKKEVISNNKS